MLTRAKTNLSAGVVGLANVGKSTLFQALAQTQAGNPANYPFATIDPEEARVKVPSPRLDELAAIYRQKSIVNSYFTIFDIAGLVKGAAQGHGLGNAFLAHIRAVDGLLQMVRVFEDPEIIHTEAQVDPIRDAQTLSDELILKDMEFVQTAMEKVQRKAKSGITKEMQDLLKTCGAAAELLDHGKPVGSSTWSPDQAVHLRTLGLLTTKPSVFVANISEEDYCFSNVDAITEDLRKWVASNYPGSEVLPLSPPLELRLVKLSPEERAAELQELGVGSSIPLLIQKIRGALGLQSFFTAGSDEVREWTIKTGSTAPEAAGVIHQDLEKTFITANVTKFHDVVEYGGDEASIKRAGKILTKGKDYVVEDGDVIHFRAASARK